jgi:phage tail-like protein
MAKDSESAGVKRNDPLPVFCFKVTIANMGAEAFFKSVSGLKYEMETIPVREGGMNSTTYQLIGGTKWSNIVLKRGFTKDSKLIAWRQSWLADKFGKRASGTITLLDTALNPQAQWEFFNSFPVKWEVSEFDGAKSELAIETLELAHEGISYTAL